MVNQCTYSSAEYLMKEDIIHNLYLAVNNSKIEILNSLPGENVSSYNLCRLTKRSGYEVYENLLNKYLIKKINYYNSNEFVKSIVSLNDFLGGFFKGRCGYRQTPMLVWSKECPWASFVIPDFNPSERFAGFLKVAIDIFKRTENVV